MPTALLANTGQNQATLTAVLIVGAVLIVLGVAAMVAVRVSRKKNASAATFTPASTDATNAPTDESK